MYGNVFCFCQYSALLFTKKGIIDEELYKYNAQSGSLESVTALTVYSTMTTEQKKKSILFCDCNAILM